MKGTLRNLVNGGQSIGAFNAKKCKFSPSKEWMMVNQILGSADCGFPPTHAQIQGYADALLKA
jgi:hypothetical protein